MGFTFSDKRTSILIDEQVPKFLHDYGPKFIKFIEKYYEWMETSKLEISIEYLNDDVEDFDVDLANLVENSKPKIKGLHTNTLSKILSIQKVDRNNYIFNVKHYNSDFEQDFNIVDPTNTNLTLTKKHSVRNELTKGYSVDEVLIFLNDPFSELTKRNEIGDKLLNIKVKSFTQNPVMASKNSWNFSDIDLTINSHVDLFMEEFMQAYPLTFPNFEGSLDINDKVGRNYTIEDFKKFLVKHSREFYQSKGTENSFRYLFRTIYNKEIEIYYPEDDILRASDNNYYQPKIIKILPENNFTGDIKSKYIYGESSGSYAVVEDYRFERNNNKDVVEIELNFSTINGLFEIGENLRFLDDNNNFKNIGTCLSLLNRVDVLESSTEKFKVGDRIIIDRNLKRVQNHEIIGDLEENYIILEVEKNESGKLYDFEILNSGKGYSLGDKIEIENDGKYLKSIPHRFLKSYVSDVCVRGSIKKIKVVCEGNGYIDIPEIISIGGREYQEGEEHNASIRIVSKDVGKPKSIKVINSGINFSNKDVKIDLNGDGNFDLELKFSSCYESAGKFLNNKGYLSDTKVLQDSFYYQKFSYVIKSDISPRDYKDILKRLVHPAGTKFFGEYYITSKVDAGVKLNYEKLSEVELNERNYIGRYSNVVLDEWSLYENFDNVEIRQNDLIPTLIEKEDDYRFLKLNGTVSLNQNSNVIVGAGTDFLTSIVSGDFIMIQNQGFEVISVVNDLEMILNQKSNETLTSENVLVRISQIDTAG